MRLRDIINENKYREAALEHFGEGGVATYDMAIERGGLSPEAAYEEAVMRHSFKPNTRTRINEAEYEGNEVELDSPFRLSDDDNHKFGVYVRNPDTDNVNIVKFGDPDMSIKRDNPEARKNFRARHDCDNKNDKTTAGYWSCQMWRADKSVEDMLEINNNSRGAHLRLRNQLDRIIKENRHTDIPEVYGGRMRHGVRGLPHYFYVLTYPKRNSILKDIIVKTDWKGLEQMARGGAELAAVYSEDRKMEAIQKAQALLDTYQ